MLLMFNDEIDFHSFIAITDADPLEEAWPVECRGLWRTETNHSTHTESRVNYTLSLLVSIPYKRIPAMLKAMETAGV